MSDTKKKEWKYFVKIAVAPKYFIKIIFLQIKIMYFKKDNICWFFLSAWQIFAEKRRVAEWSSPTGS
jgi:hypothetical protein